VTSHICGRNAIGSPFCRSTGRTVSS